MAAWIVCYIRIKYSFPVVSITSLTPPFLWPSRYNPCPTRRRSSRRRLQFPLSGRVPGIGKEWNPVGDWNLWRYKFMLCCDILMTFVLVLDNPAVFYFCPSLWKSPEINWNLIVTEEMCLMSTLSDAVVQVLVQYLVLRWIHRRTLTLLKRVFTQLPLLNSSSTTFF